MPNATANPTPQRLTIQTDPGQVNIQAADAAGEGEAPRFDMIAYSGGRMKLEGFNLPVVVDLNGLTIPAQTRPVRFNHSLEAGVGHSERIAIENGQLIAEGRISRNTEQAREVIDSARRGFPWKASIGAKATRIERIGEGQPVNVNGQNFTGPLLVAREAILGEFSFVDLGADQNSRANIAAADGDAQKGEAGDNTGPAVRREIARLSDAGMTDEQIAERTNRDASTIGQIRRREIENPPEELLERLRQIPTPERQTDAGGDNQGLHNMPETEINRRARIYAVCGEKHQDIAGQAVSENWSPRDAELAVMRASRSSGGIATRRDTGQADIRASDTLAAALLIHAGRPDVAEKHISAQAAQAGSDLRARSLMDICAQALTTAHQEIPREQDRLIRAAFSTTSMPTALTVAGDKLALDGYQQAPAAWRNIARRLPVPNFREHHLIRPLTQNSSFEKVGGDGELKHVTFGEETYQVRAETYGKQGVVTRQDVVNDDLGAFTQLFNEFGMLAGLRISDEVFRTLLANANNFFSAGNGNFDSGADTALGIDAFGAAVAALRNQTDGDGNPIGLQPTTLLVPTSLEAKGRQLLNSSVITVDTSDMTGTANPWAGAAELAVEPRLNNADYPGNSELAWYLFANPANAPAVVVAFLNGTEGPTVEQVEPGPNVLGIGIRGYIDFGVALADHRGAVKMDGE